MGPNPATASSRRRRYAPPPLWQIAAACLLLLPAFCAAIPRQLQQTTTPVFSEAPEAGDTLSSFLERAGGFDMFLASLKHLGYDRPLDGRDALPSPPRCVRAPRGPCFLWMCPPALPCVPVAAEEKPLALAKEDGPFTVLAFNDTAFARLLGDWAKERGRDEPLALADVLRDDALESRLDDLIRYHIVKRGGDGAETYETRATGGAPAYETAQTARESNGTTGSDLVIFRGADGRIKFHEDCVDRAPPAVDHGCHLQAEWGKCGEDWMAGFCEMSCGRCACGEDSAACRKEAVISDITLTEAVDPAAGDEEDPDPLSVTVHVLSAPLRPPARHRIPTPPPPPPPPPPTRPPVYVWNPYTHRQEIMAEWNATTQTYQTPEDPTKGVESSQPRYSYEYRWNEDAGKYEYVMNTRD